jgi:hypothetical protein
MDAFKTFTFTDGRKLELHHDESPESPREWDNMGTMAFFHQRYDLGDKDHGADGRSNRPSRPNVRSFGYRIRYGVE